MRGGRCKRKSGGMRLRMRTRDERIIGARGHEQDAQLWQVCKVLVRRRQHACQPPQLAAAAPLQPHRWLTMFLADTTVFESA